MVNILSKFRIIKKLEKFKTGLSFLTISFITYLLLDLSISSALFFSSNNPRNKYFLKNYPLALRTIFLKKLALPKIKIETKIRTEYEPFSLLGYFDPKSIVIISDGIHRTSLEDSKKFQYEVDQHKKKGGKLSRTYHL